MNINSFHTKSKKKKFKMENPDKTSKENHKCVKNNKRLIKKLSKLNKLHITYLGKKIKMNIACPELNKSKSAKKKRKKSWSLW